MQRNGRIDRTKGEEVKRRGAKSIGGISKACLFSSRAFQARQKATDDAGRCFLAVRFCCHANGPGNKNRKLPASPKLGADVVHLLGRNLKKLLPKEANRFCLRGRVEREPSLRTTLRVISLGNVPYPSGRWRMVGGVWKKKTIVSKTDRGIISHEDTPFVLI